MISKETFNLLKQNNRLAQKQVYDAFSGKMLAIAKSYTNNLSDAEDALLKAFYTVFTKIDTCKGAEFFPFWLRRIVINEAISIVRKQKHILYIEQDINDDLQDELEDAETQNHLLDIPIEELLSEMPLGYKLVFNLYVFEEKKHSEIAEILNIKEGTSKSQFNKAKKWLKEFITQKQSYGK
ncbi:RNA polymerase sigma factor [Riemerella anatipestifer]|uniref:RNA polymerase sigma factor n=1 Tax=Riemerella anatipestifer TaxID=34085 RepID=UPI0030C08846